MSNIRFICHKFYLHVINHNFDMITDDMHSSINDILGLTRGVAYSEELYITLMNYGLWAPCAIATFNQFSQNSQNKIKPFDLDQKIGFLINHPINKQYLECYLQTNSNSYLLLWAYSFSCHNLFIELAKKYINPSKPENFDSIWDKIIAQKIEGCTNACLEDIMKFGELIQFYFGSSPDLNDNQLLDKLKTSLYPDPMKKKSSIERELIKKYISTPLIWFHGIQPQPDNNDDDKYDFNKIADDIDYDVKVRHFVVPKPVEEPPKVEPVKKPSQQQKKESAKKPAAQNQKKKNPQKNSSEAPTKQPAKIVKPPPKAVSTPKVTSSKPTSEITITKGKSTSLSITTKPKS